tara:strand:- start:311 stop:517 length:207 start_codon:yes stop_codon:yes gene_type:complete
VEPHLALQTESAGGMITLFAISAIEFQPVPLGVFYGLGGANALVTSLYATRVTKKLGVSNTMVLCMFS